MGRVKKYFKSKNEAFKACEERNATHGTSYFHVFKMPLGTRRHGQYAVCSELEYLNTY